MNKHGKRGLGNGKSRQRKKPVIKIPPRLPCPYGCKMDFGDVYWLEEHERRFHERSI